MEGNIAAFLKSKGYVDRAVSRADALKAFDDLVQTNVLGAMQTSLGTSPLPLELCIVLMALINFTRALDKHSGLARQYGILDEKVWPLVLSSFTNSFARMPCCMELISWLASKCLHLRGCKECAWIVFIWLAVLWSGFALILVLGQTLLDKVTTSNEFTTSTLLFLLFEAVSLAVLGAVWLCQVRQTKTLSLLEDGRRHTVRKSIRQSRSVLQ